MPFTRRECIGLLTARLATAGSTPLLQRWRQIASASDGAVGAAALHLGTNQHVALNAERAYPLASVCKLPIAMRLLNLVDEQQLRLTDEIEVLRQDVWPSWEGDLAGNWPRQRRWKLDDLIRVMVVHSDNTAVETLFRIAGGAGGMAASFRKWQVRGVRVDRYEGECYLASHGIDPAPPIDQWRPGLFEELVGKVPLAMQQAGMRKFLADPRDTGTPDGAVQLLARTFRGELLSPASTLYLKSALTASTTGKDRLKGLLPPSTVVAHKTGTTSSVSGWNGSTSDIGVITFPRDAGHFALAVFVSGSSRAEPVRAKVIAQLARAAYDAWSA